MILLAAAIFYAEQGLFLHGPSKSIYGKIFSANAAIAVMGDGASGGSDLMKMNVPSQVERYLKVGN